MRNEIGVGYAWKHTDIDSVIGGSHARIVDCVESGCSEKQICQGYRRLVTILFTVWHFCTEDFAQVVVDIELQGNPLAVLVIPRCADAGQNDLSLPLSFTA